MKKRTLLRIVSLLFILVLIFCLEACDDTETSTDPPTTQLQSESTTEAEKEKEDPDEESHTHRGGTASCSSKAICEICGEKYGNLVPDHPTESGIFPYRAWPEPSAHSGRYARLGCKLFEIQKSGCKLLHDGPGSTCSEKRNYCLI